MTLVRRSSPFGELVSLRQAMDRLFEDSFVRPNRWAGQTGESFLPLDVRATPDSLVVEAALPGVKPEDVDLTIEDGTLTITAKTAEEHGLRVDVLAESPSVAGLVDALAEYGTALRLAAVEAGEHAWRPSQRRWEVSICRSPLSCLQRSQVRCGIS